MLKVESYAYGSTEHEFVNVGEIYYLGELWNGTGEGDLLLEDGTISMYDVEDDEWRTVAFEIVNSAEDILQVEVKVTEIYS